MSAPLRIRASVLGKESGGTNFDDYLSRLIKMIPAEIVGLYTVGRGVIPQDSFAGLLIWEAVCLIILLFIRYKATSDPANNEPAQPIPIFVAAVAFIIWIYTFGEPFIHYKIYVPYIGSLAVLLWSFLIPAFMKGA